MHDEATVIEPLPPLNIAVTQKKGHATVSWTSQSDPQEPSADPSYYIVYTAIGKGGYDNGVKTSRPSYSITLQLRHTLSLQSHGGQPRWRELPLRGRLSIV